jgi:ribonuclease BN (tRNA processing enzyme)
MFERTFDLSEYQPDTEFRVGPLVVTPTRVPHYRLETYAFRVEADGRSLAYSGDSAPSEELVEAARDADLFVCEATLLRGDLDGQPRGHLSLEEAVEAFEASGAGRLLVTHRPCELPKPEGFELAYDGLELDV